MLSQFQGEFAALATAICFSFGPIYFTLAGKIVGSGIVNRTRLVFAVFFLTTLHWILLGTPLPVGASPDKWFWFTISGVIGLTLGDAALFQAFVMIGARLSILIFATNPIIGAVLAWVFLDERLSPIKILGMVITLIGVIFVLAEKNSTNEINKDKKNFYLGIFFAFLGAAGQAGGLITAKFGLTDNFPTLSGIVIRMLTAMIAIWIWTILSKKVKLTFSNLKENPLSIKYIALASMIGPVFGVWFSLTAVKFTEVGIASTIISLNPIFIIPLNHYYFKEKVSKRGIVGTIVALVGVAILFLY